LKGILKIIAMKVNIFEPCPANWDHMQIKLNARHCEQCDKSVVDFTQKSRAEIISYLLENPNGSVCGRMSQQQFDIKEEDLPELISILSQAKHRHNAFFILAIVCSSLFYSCESKPKDNTQTIGKAKIEHRDEVTTGKMMIPTTTEDTVKHKKNHKSTTQIPQVRELMGEVSIMPVPEPPVAGGITFEPQEPEVPLEVQKDEVLPYAEVMPEFPGGMKEMVNFLNKNLIYPQEMLENGIEGKIYVQFTVTKTGEIKDAVVVRGVNGLNVEALRLVKQMPNWKPGSNDGKVVDVKMIIPITFSLN